MAVAERVGRALAEVVMLTVGRDVIEVDTVALTVALVDEVGAEVTVAEDELDTLLDDEALALEEDVDELVTVAVAVALALGEALGLGISIPVPAAKTALKSKRAVCFNKLVIPSGFTPGTVTTMAELAPLPCTVTSASATPKPLTR